MISERAWRRDPVEGPDATRIGEVDEGGGPRSGGVTRGGRWSGAVRSWAHAFVGRLPGLPVGFEQVLHPFVLGLATAADRHAVESALLRAARKVAPATRIDLIAESGPGEVAAAGGGTPAAHSWRRRGGGGECLLDVPIRSGAVVHGRLRVYSEAGGPSSIGKEAGRRLTTLCTMAGLALQKYHAPSERPWQHDDAGVGDESAAVGHEPYVSKEFNHTPMLRDATFLSAVLPFALGQINRHRESLSLLWVAIDRLAAIETLLGRVAVDQLVRHVGEVVSTLLRSSDIVVRLEDDRIVVVLPRAAGADGLSVAQKIRREVADKNRPAAVIPGVTVSIGVAAFPACARNVVALFNAADEALEQARGEGGDRAVLAPTLPAPTPHARARAADPMDKTNRG